MTDKLDRLKAALADRYAIDRELGAGGMATVYLAHDIKHDRQVAVKVLRPELAVVLGGERFLNEIKVTANLQHPHILPLFDSGVADSFLFYVMPLVEGESLQDKLDREKLLGVEEAVRLAHETAQALDYAHRQGVIHRDIKPANILLHDGSAQVADFGIALALRAAGGDRLTETGLSLGTPHYMSPEQATADREVDARSDIYSLAAVLYEMLAGEPPHTGGTVQAIISKVITEDPRPLDDHRKSVPVHICMAVERALARIPADRFATAAEFATALKDPQATVAFARTSRARTAATTGASRLARDWRLLPIAVILLLLGATVGRFLRGNETAPALTARFSVPTAAAGTPEGARGLTGAPVNTVALSPDGRMIAFVGRSGSGDRLYLRALDELEPRPIPGTQGGAFPAFSPDGTRLSFIASDGALMQLSLSGGTPTRVANANTALNTGAVWLDGQSFLVTPSDGSLARIGLDGSQTTIAVPNTSVSRESEFFGTNMAVPGGRTVLTVVGSATGVNGPLIGIDLQTGERTTIIENPVNSAWYANNHLLWVQPDGVMLGAPFDPDELRLTGSPVTLAEGVRLAIGGQGQVAVANNGSLIYVPTQSFNLTLVDRSGLPEVLAEGRQFHSPRFSPDGSTIALDFIQSGDRDVWTLDLGQRTLSRLSFENDGHDPVWSHDGRSVFFVSRGSIRRRRADGSGVTDSVFAGPVLTSVIDVSEDGTIAITAPSGSHGDQDVAALNLDGVREQTLILGTPFTEQHPALSPDDRWLAYSSNETGQFEIYVRPFPGGGARTAISRGGGTEPVWNPNGREVFYQGTREGVPFLYSATVSASNSELTVTGRTALFDISEYEPASPHPNYDIAPDGERFVFVHLGTLSEIVFVQNWTEEVNRRSEVD